jgi:hypothetical protein
MKTLTLNINNASVYILDDETELTVSADNIVVGSPAQFIIGDCNMDNCNIYGNVNPPHDWVGHKYCFDGSAWTNNPNWKDPSTSAI